MAFSYFRNGMTMRNKRYRLTKYYRKEIPNIELYDHSNDSLVTSNVAT
ncbi:MAG: hypothetical protein KAQ62_17105 [Cyclobacteriaceae bacterium]|nr:hypothetical protein [Cyclobacteriaceae bacterium]MCK5207922.1 hypothetical protein [Cyclobacteriaceae bacterium]MCK5277973.1 hypothetical protein [Cyclobacteriaceae bacterium]MCK5370285.1 hypothetical protein [Cyclobacteriaceae bacterium]MCK5471487.1 hypothetical protein [Cyclobacteriaceae bacterium]